MNFDTGVNNIDDAARHFFNLYEILTHKNPPSVTVELEFREIIPRPRGGVNGSVVEIKYYVRRDAHGVTYRCVDGLLTSKQTIASFSSDNRKLVLSVEKRCKQYFDLIPMNIRKIKRESVEKEHVRIDITEEILDNGKSIFTREIEIKDKKGLEQISSSTNYWPPPKPHAVYVSDLWNTFKNGGYITPKYDGQRYILYLDKEKKSGSILDEKGESTGVCDEVEIVIDCEIIDDTIYAFDVMCNRGEDISNLRMEVRQNILNDIIANINKVDIVNKSYVLLYKKHIYFKTFEQLQRSFNECFSTKISSDGVILTQAGPYKLPTFKSKPIPTVDLLHVEGILYLNNNLYVEPTELDLEEGKIYEFAINTDSSIGKLVRIRPDKISPNVRMPPYEDPVSLMVTGEGCRSLRAYMNHVKREMLSELHGDLIDVGTGTGGDFTKWKHLDNVYAIEPLEILRKVPENITIVKKRLQDIDITKIKAENMSLFFIPELNNLVEYMALCRPSKIIGISMTDPKPLQDKHAKLLIDDKIHLQIPHSKTAIDVVESKLNWDKFTSDMYSLGYKLAFIEKLGNEFMTETEKKLCNMYSKWCFVIL